MPRHSSRLTSSTKQQKNSSTNTLKKYVAISLLAQVVLSITVLFVTVLSDRIVNEAYKYVDLAASQRFIFQNIGLTIRRFSEEINTEKPNTRLISRIQNELKTQSYELKLMARQIDDAIQKTGQFQLLTIAKAGSEIMNAKSQLDEFILAVDKVAITPYEKLKYTDAFFNKINLTIAPTSSIATAINSAVEELRTQANRYENILFFVRISIVVLMIIIVASLGLFLIYPALSNLANSMEREQKLRNKMEAMLRTDPLTDIDNREGLNIVLNNLNDKQTYALAMIDLNLFKAINDTFGHVVGDAVLIEIAKRLKDLCKDNAFPFRLGGDEFAVLRPNTNDIETCSELGEKLISLFSEPISFLDRQYTISGSIGIALSNDVQGDFDDIVKAADTAMYTLKGTNKSGYKIYCKKQHNVKIDLNRKYEIKNALLLNEIMPWYQPKVDMRNGNIHSFEALARWHYAENQILTPQDFINDIEEYGFHYELTISMLEQSLTQLRLWKEKDFELIPISINVCADVLAARDSVRGIKSIIQKFNDVKRFITIEITEDVFLPRIANAIKESIKELIDEGLSFSIDDFGSGYASFNHLNQFTFHELKIDQSFIHGIGKDKTAEVILEAISSIGKGLKVDLVAEGIETQEQVDFLLGLNCFIAQGYFYFKPMQSNKIEKYLHRYSNSQLKVI